MNLFQYRKFNLCFKLILENWVRKNLDKELENTIDHYEFSVSINLTTILFSSRHDNSFVIAMEHGLYTTREVYKRGLQNGPAVNWSEKSGETSRGGGSDL